MFWLYMYMRMFKSKRKLAGETQISLRLITLIRLQYSNNHEIHIVTSFADSPDLFFLVLTQFSSHYPAIHSTRVFSLLPNHQEISIHFMYVCRIRRSFSLEIDYYVFVRYMIWFLFFQERFFKSEFSGFHRFSHYDDTPEFLFLRRMIQDNWQMLPNYTSILCICIIMFYSQLPRLS